MRTVHRQAYIPEMDGLRALAVLSVVIYHAFPGFLPGGFVGVDIFLVISGYLITRLLHTEWQATGALDICAFYARRARRILPMLVTVVLCTLVAVWLLLDSDALHETAASAAAALLFAANAYFQATTGGYFDPATERLALLHLWSLGVEEQFYLLWPLMLALLLRTRPGRIVPVVLVAAIASAVLAVAMCIISPHAAFYLMPTRFWELAAGGLIALGAGNPRQRNRGASAAGAGLALMLVAIVAPTQGFAAVNVALAALGATVLIRALHQGSSLGMVGQVLRSRPALLLGLISYSLYLWHWPLLAIARAMHTGPVPAAALAGLCVAAVVVAWLGYHLIETPLRRPDPAISHRRLVTTSLLMCASLSGMSWATASLVEPPPTLATHSLSEVVLWDRPRDPHGCHFNAINKLDPFPKRGCERPDDKPSVIIWGDSHAWAMGPFAQELASREGMPWMDLTRDACPPAVGYEVNRARPLESDTCRKFNDLAFAQIRKADVLIMTARWDGYAYRDELLQHVASTVAAASGIARRVLLMGPSPTLKDRVPRCIQADDLPACSLPRSQFDAQTRKISAALAAVASRHDNVVYVDRADYFCTPFSCDAMRDGFGLYWDAHHATSTAARSFARSYLDATAAWR